MDANRKEQLISKIRSAEVDKVEVAFELLYQIALISGAGEETRFTLVELAKALDAKYDGQRIIELIEMVNALPEANDTNMLVALHLLQFANDELRITAPYPDPESEYDECVVCGKAEFRHDPNCRGVAWKAEVKKFLEDHNG
jgi:hypothetical protein